MCAWRFGAPRRGAPGCHCNKPDDPGRCPNFRLTTGATALSRRHPPPESMDTPPPAETRRRQIRKARSVHARSRPSCPAAGGHKRRCQKAPSGRWRRPMSARVGRPPFPSRKTLISPRGWFPHRSNRGRKGPLGNLPPPWEARCAATAQGARRCSKTWWRRAPAGLPCRLPRQLPAGQSRSAAD